LIDFGIARRFAPGKSKDTGPLGSPGYAAPEQYGRTQTDERTDIYGLGATLQTLLTGRDPLELRQGLLPLQPDPIPAELQALIDSMLEVDPEKRPQHVRIIEERFAWWARKTVDWLTAVKGVLIGLFFWVWYALLEWGISILRHSDFSHMLIPPFKVRLFLVVLNIFPLAIVGTAIYQGFALLFREKNRRIQAACVLIMLLLLFLLSLLLKLPPLFQGYPFFPAPPFKP